MHSRWLMIDGMVAGGRCLGGKQSSDHTRTDQETENVDQDDNCAVRCHCSEHRRYSIGCDQETKSPAQRPTGSRHRPARRPTFRSLQSPQSLPSRSHRRWYPWLQSNARALLNYTDHGGQGMRGGHSSRSFRLGNSKFASKRNQGPVTLPRDRRENEAFKQAWARRHEQHCLAAIEMLDH
jgi:hypothetical protein